MKHEHHPTWSNPHPFKGTTLCGKMVRFGSLISPGEMVTCKLCLKIKETICPTCNGTGTKP